MNPDKGKQEWIDGVLGSTKGMQRASPGNGTYDRAITGLSRPDRRSTPLFTRWAAAAIVLVAVNVASVYYYSTNVNDQAAAGSTSLAAQMQSETVYNY
jgi:hypothetical protein